MLLATGLAVTFCFGALYVASMYLATGGRLANRNESAVIFRRVYAALAVSMVCAAIVCWLVADDSGHFDSGRALGLSMSLDSSELVQLLVGVGPTVALFAGPLVHWALEWSEGGYRWRDHGPGRTVFLRNLLVGPLTEEVVFRACTLATLRLISPPLSAFSMVSWSAAVFGLAHMHHVIQHIVYEKMRWRLAVQVVLFQLVYTSLFGSYAAWLFLRQNHLLSVVLVHSFCNAMEFPQIGVHRTHRRWPLIAVAYATGFLAFVGSFFL